MKTDKGSKSHPKSLTKETGLRLPTDQMQKLDLLVGLSQGRRKRSHLIVEAIDEFLSLRLSRMASTGRI